MDDQKAQLMVHLLGKTKVYLMDVWKVLLREYPMARSMEYQMVLLKAHPLENQMDELSAFR